MPLETGLQLMYNTKRELLIRKLQQTVRMPAIISRQAGATDPYFEYSRVRREYRG